MLSISLSFGGFSDYHLLKYFGWPTHFLCLQLPRSSYVFFMKAGCIKLRNSINHLNTVPIDQALFFVLIPDIGIFLLH